MLRRASIEDLDGLQRIEDVCFQDRRFRRELLEWILRNARALALVEEAEGRIRAALLLLFEGRVGRVLSIAVEPKARRRGIATRLMFAAEDAARDRGCGIVRLEVGTANLAAIALYRRLGYGTEGLLPKYYSWGEDAFEMRKVLERPPDVPHVSVASAPIHSSR